MTGTYLPINRSLVALIAIAFLILSSSRVQAQPLTPSIVKAGSSPALIVNSSGFFDLSQVAASQISIVPGTGVANIQISNAMPVTATVTFDIASTAPAGQRMLVISAGDVTVSIKLLVADGTPPVCNSNNCRLPRVCDGDTCVLECSPSNCHAPRACDDNGVCSLPPVCNPRCRPPQVCMPGNRCEVQQ